MTPMVKGLLLRFPAGAQPKLKAAGASFGLAGVELEFEPLFATRAPSMSLTVGAQEWFLARPKRSTTGANPWDFAHEAHARLATGVGLAAGAAPEFIEPDLEQPWLYETPAPVRAVAADADACVFEDQDRDLPIQSGEFAWHLGDDFSQLRRARAEVGNARGVRIVHLDTGYDADHATFPRDRIDVALQWNFVENNNDARDPGVGGMMRNPGHGTGTLSILAGGQFAFSGSGYDFDDVLGGTTTARIVPMRIGNSVVQLTTSNVAQAIAYATELCGDDSTRVDVISMSMGGVASAAWADAVNNAYEAGIIYVAAAGNNISSGFFGFPTHQIVYPARFRRVIAACGVMANRQPYYGLSFGTMQGNWGPEGAMATALSAFTPNLSWARYGCREIVRMNGAGTSSATPQIAAAAALYLQAHAAELFDANRYPEPWMRVEAVRRALFLSADSSDGGSVDKLGNGILRAADALALAPADAQSLQKTRPDKAGFPFLNVLSGTALAPSPADQMLQLEATQLVQRWNNPNERNPLEAAVPDPDRPASDVGPDQVRAFLEVVRAHPQASQRLQERAGQVLDRMTGGAGRRSPKAPPREPIAAPTPSASKRAAFVPPGPPYRKLRAYAADPSLTTTLDTAGMSEVTFKVPWEQLTPGPVGEYLEVMDVDPASGTIYEPINLDDPMLLAQDGLPPSEGVPQFHQQMAYAICSLTIQNFERALGRKTLWRPGPAPKGAHEKDDSHYVQRLRIYPHALREANAYYSPQKVALLFGYFNAGGAEPGKELPGGRIFTCLSHDIVAHETTHALLDGMHRRFLLPSNPDVHAFHEGFADCVAMLQHFTFPEMVAHQIATTRGAIDSQENMLVQLAAQFGRATGKRMALRDAIGEVKDNAWRVRPADPSEYETTQEPHDPGAHSGRRGFRRVPVDLQTADGGSLEAGNRGNGHAAPRRHPSRPGQPPGERGVQVRAARAYDVHPRPRLLPADRHHLRRIPPCDYHGGLRSHTRRCVELSRLVRGGVSASRHLPARRTLHERRQPNLAFAE